MKHVELMAEAAKLVQPRGAVYGDIRENHEQNILMVMLAVKLSRIARSPEHVDSYLDALNYLSFAGELATEGEA